MSETDYITTATTTYDYDEEGYLLKEVTITEVAERANPTPVRESFPFQFPTTQGRIQQCGGSLSSTEAFAPIYTINTARDRKSSDGYL